MKTASFSTYTGPGRVSIARFAPRGTPAGFRIYKPLAPGAWFNSVDYPKYRELYFGQLATLSAEKVLQDLRVLANGAEPVLLCYEKPPFDEAKNFCHRRMAAEWFERELGLKVPEYEAPGTEKPL